MYDQHGQPYRTQGGYGGSARAGADVGLDPVFALLATLLGGLLGFGIGALTPDFVEGTRVPVTVGAMLSLVLAANGALAVRSPSGRLRTLLAVTSGLYFVVAAGLHLAFALLAAGAGVALGLSTVLALLYLIVAVALSRTVS